MSKVDEMISDIQAHLDSLNSTLNRFSSAQNKAEILQRAKRDIDYIEPKLQPLDAALRKSADAEEFEEDVKHIHSDFTQAKAEYFRYNETVQTNQASPLEAGNAKQRSAIDDLKKANADADTVNDVLNQDLLTLEEDHKILENVHQNTKEIDNQAEIGTNRANRMLRRICCNKFITLIIILVLVAVLGVVLWNRFTPGQTLYCHKNKNSVNCTHS